MWLEIKKVLFDEVYREIFRKALLAGKKVFFRFANDNDKKDFRDTLGKLIAFAGVYFCPCKIAVAGFGTGASVGGLLFGGIPGVLIGSVIGQ